VKTAVLLETHRLKRLLGQISVDVEFASRQVYVTHAPGLLGVDPRIGRSGRGQIDPYRDVGRRFAAARRRGALGANHDAAPVIGFDRAA